MNTNRVIFLDFDGVIRVDLGRTGALDIDFCPERIERVRKCCEILEAQVVVSSDWRNFGNRGEIERNLGRLATRLHDDWMTPITGHRWNEVQAWLVRHPEVTEYAVLEDFEPHFDGAPSAMRERIVWCNNRHGFVAELSGRLCGLFRPAAGATGGA